MKSIVAFFAALFCVAGFASAQQNITIPDAVKKSFTTKYPNVTNVAWEKENGNFEAEWKVEGRETSAVFDASGKWLLTETEIQWANVPGAVAKSLKLSDNGTWYPREIERIEKADGSVLYEIKIESNKVYKEVVYKEDGTFVSEEGDDDSDDEENDD